MAAIDATRSTERPTGEAELVALLALSRVRGVGPGPVCALVDHFGSGVAATRAIPSLPDASLAALMPGRRSPGKRALAGLRAPRLEVARDLLAAATERGLRLLAYGTPAYPPAVADLVDPPPVLFLEGTLPVAGRAAVAIVGTRSATPYGLRRAHALGRELGRWGWSVVSGMARGIDASAHAGALDGGGHTVGVLGSGHDHDYPPENRDLYERVRAEGGGLLSEFEPDTPPSRGTFPRRNRLIAALSRAVVVVEAGRRSGALITVDHALDLGREVLAVPCRVGDPGAPGILKLLRQGAGLACGARDVFDAVGWVHDLEGPAPHPPAAERAGGASADRRDGPPESAILGLLAAGSLSPDEIALRLGIPVDAAVRRLGRLELEGWIDRRPAGRVALAPRDAEART